MANLQLSLAITNNPRTWPIIDGRAKADGIDFTTSVVDPSEMFWRQLHYAEFDVSEMSMSSLMMITAQGDKRFYALPVFTTRYFFHTKILARKDAKIDSPADLKGKRVGVPEYQQTAALWIRGALENEFGVSPRDITHFMERPPSRSHAGAVGFKAPSGVAINQIPPEKSIGSMLIAGELDATSLYFGNEVNIIDRTSIDLRKHPDIKPVFPDTMAECARYYKKTGIFPINHAMIIRRSLVEKYPWAPMSIYHAMVEANEAANKQRIEHMQYYIETGLVPRENAGIIAEPIVRHGLKANRKTLEICARYSHEQGLTSRLMTLEELFAPSTLNE